MTIILQSELDQVTWSIERNARWDATAVLPETSQRVDRPGGPCCPHCGNKEFLGGPMPRLLERLRTARSNPLQHSSMRIVPECVVCEHVWQLTLTKKHNVVDSDWIEWKFMGVGTKFEPIRVLARYYQGMSGRHGLDAANDAQQSREATECSGPRTPS